ncbi:aminotransferase class I/II-fold pyridoxal phosphate-dependent enzyme [Listeria welshimeri]|nr:aminotransferase class I/II-fold pyridoxal phosphate-dependent enzyme [Listeria welshimeri]MBC1667892.1 aminotransferase class I/II-fold pyridoxal phosphate-dependent enzyme [Listeria welshimeri]MBC1685005.1 aminotransferase class I/II-fold pyridoxal phosphate-dependent enzyme [Listeria welshimeri]MBC1859799.1 aminotransferase class I/II-fold pyridoxal phosphate-dependent enzyme [Listeria welshimeri]
MNLIHLGEPEIGSFYDDEELEAIKNEFDIFSKGSTFKTKNEIKEKIKLFEDAFSSKFNVNYSVAVSSGASALDIILEYLSLNNNSEIIAPAIGFHGTYLSIIRSGAKLVLCDSDINLNVDTKSLEECISKNTLAVVITHMNGLPCDMDEINKAIDKKEREFGTSIKLIGDAARSCGSLYKGRNLSDYEWATYYSFQRKKQITTLGEGGMITTKDKFLYDFLISFRSFGLGKELGGNFKITPMQASVGIVQLKKLNQLNNSRRTIAKRRTEYFTKHLKDFLLPLDNEDYFNTFYLYSLLVPEHWTELMRNELILYMKKHYNIGCCIANDVVYKSNPYIARALRNKKFPKSEKIGSRTLSIILHPMLDINQEKFINQAFVESVRKIEKRRSE